MTAYDLALRFVGEIQEQPGAVDHPFIVWSHSLCGLGLQSPDEISWCSSWANAIAWMLRLPRSKSAAARSWLSVGIPIGSLFEAQVGYDVVILNRNGPTDPSVAGPGHVGFYAGREPDYVLILGGNQSNGVSIARFPVSRVLGIRRLKA